MDKRHSKPDQSVVRRFVADMRVSLAFFSRLPTRPEGSFAAGRLANAAYAFPLVGVVIGSVAALAYLAASALGLTPLLAASLGVGTGVWLSRGLHEDGLADFADGLGGGSDRRRRLEIMRDSRIGAFGVLALIFALGLRIGSLAALAEPMLAVAALVAAAAVSRAAITPLMCFMPHARGNGLSRQAGRVGRVGMLVALALAGITAFLLLPPAAALWALLASAAAATAIAAMARQKLGGQTGDVLGAAQQTSEAAFLLATAATLS